MLSKNEQKFIKNLQKKKQRQIYNKFTVEGDKICREVIKNRPELVDKLFATQDWLGSTNLSLPFNHTIVTEKELSLVSNMVTNTQALLVLHQPPLIYEYTKHSGNHELILDNIQDPGNMGTILRIADWFGIKRVICSKGCVDIFNPKVIQSTMGAFLRVETIQNHDIVNLLSTEKKPVFAGLLNGNPLEDEKEKEKGKAKIQIGSKEQFAGFRRNPCFNWACTGRS